MNLGKYVHELLLENETVIIPGFGAFTSIYKPSYIDEETDELKPPSKVIGFNSQIRNNDGLLVSKVANEEGISQLDALKLIEKESENITYYLDKMGRTTLEDTGELFYDENNKIQFNPVEDDNILLDSYGLEPISLNIISGEVEENEEIRIAEGGNEKEIAEADPELKKAISGLLVDVEPKSPEIVIPETFNDETAPVEIQKTEPEESEKDLMHSLSEEYEKKKQRKWLWLLVILVPIIAVGIYLIMSDKTDDFVDPYKELEESLTIDKEVQVAQPEMTVVTKDTSTVSQPDSFIQSETETTQVEEIVSSEVPKYYLVSGSFKEEENALEYFRQLKNEGFEPINSGKNGSYYIISIGAYDTEREALKAKKEYESKVSKPGVWVLKK